MCTICGTPTAFDSELGDGGEAVVGPDQLSKKKFYVLLKQPVPRSLKTSKGSFVTPLKRGLLVVHTMAAQEPPVMRNAASCKSELKMPRGTWKTGSARLARRVSKQACGALAMYRG